MEMDRRSYLARARGLGSAKSGTGHHIAHRGASALLVVLLLWFVYALAVPCEICSNFGAMQYWLSRPWNAVLLSALIVTFLYHSLLTMQTVIEDYVHHQLGKLASLMVLKVFIMLAGAYSLFSILKVSLMG